MVEKGGRVFCSKICSEGERGREKGREGERGGARERGESVL